ncbi:unnamed protein product [Medioppia subpectinata]|uniref:Bcl-2 Bcl-2 homology region 1-3 domain-containing protein n=1 Tax=Medioppia subpectinata TaxID=1979941 RepID=A0A7R9KWY0_9ACAR|nr:unnamed protein product [Medioppia subpectinata]CAG2111042.1 unnamed protein product [Medioppia subpectinata]
MAIKCEPSLDETEAVARELFTQFTRDRFIAEGIITEDNHIIQQQIQEYSSFSLSNGYNISSHVMVSVGRDLRRISESFARSAERAEVREKAFRINLRDLTKEEFNSLLSELFLNGTISRERIVVLFFFCSDLAVNAFTNGPIGYFKRLIQWSLSYIFNNICLWVQKHGGWEIVLGSYVPRLAITACAILGCIAFGIYIKRSLF